MLAVFWRPEKELEASSCYRGISPCREDHARDTGVTSHSSTAEGFETQLSVLSTYSISRSKMRQQKGHFSALSIY